MSYRIANIFNAFFRSLADHSNAVWESALEFISKRGVVMEDSETPEAPLPATSKFSTTELEIVSRLDGTSLVESLDLVRLF